MGNVDEEKTFFKVAVSAETFKCRDNFCKSERVFDREEKAENQEQLNEDWKIFQFK